MLNIPDETKEDFMSDSAQRQIYIEVEKEYTDVGGVNWYTGDVKTTYRVGTSSAASTSFPMTSIPVFQNIDKEYLELAPYVYVSVNVSLPYVSSTKLPDEMYLSLGNLPAEEWLNFDTYKYTLTTDMKQQLSNEGLRVYVRFDKLSALKDNIYLVLQASPNTDATLEYYVSKPQVESSNIKYTADDLINNALPFLGENVSKIGKRVSDYIHIARPDILPLTNKDLDMEKFSLTESLCSGDELKFGACEAAHCEFSVIGRYDDFTNRTIYPYYLAGTPEKLIQSVNLGYSGFNGIRLDTPYTANWLDVKVSSNFRAPIFGNDGNIVNLDSSIINNMQDTLYFNFACDFSLDIKSTDIQVQYAKVYLVWAETDGQTHMPYELPIIDITKGKTLVVNSTPFTKQSIIDIARLHRLYIAFCDKDGISYPESSGNISFSATCNNIRCWISESVPSKIPEFTDLKYFHNSHDTQMVYVSGKIPLGKFKTSDVKKSYVYNTCQLDITAYDDLVKLDTNAANWYTMYMYNTMFTKVYWGAPYPRQVYSSLWNLLNYLGLDNRKRHTEQVFSTRTLGDSSSNLLLEWEYETGEFFKFLEFGHIELSIADIKALKGHPVVIDVRNLYEIDDKLPLNIDYSVYGDYKKHVDAYGRGAYNVANILVKELVSDSNGGYYNQFSVNSGDYFMLSDGCISADIYIAYRFFQHNYPSTSASKCAIIGNKVTIKSVTDLNTNLINGSTRLVYYNFSTHELFPCDSSITARDVIRSLLEVTGCFFNLDRYGIPEFRYCVQSGLYPSDHLYPSDSLYPRGVSVTIPMTRYISATCQDYQVQDYGRIQIVKSQTSNETTSICEWEHIGDANLPNAYIIDDNIFYCSDGMVYDRTNMPEVDRMLRNLYEAIKNMGYTPNVTKAVGMPWVEVGDRAIVLTKTGGFETFVFRRTLSGIQGVRDEIEATGSEYSDIVYDYGYKNF